MKRLTTIALMLWLPLIMIGQTDKIYKSIAEVKNPEEVYILKLNYKRYKSIPKQVFTYTNLRVLDLSRNSIDSIPPEIGNLVNLEELNLERNHIHYVPQELGNLREMRVLTLSRNPILDLPETMSQMQHLEELHIWFTGIVSFPPSFVVLDNTLRLIDMRECPMTRDNQEEIDNLLPTPRKRWNYTCNCN